MKMLQRVLGLTVFATLLIGARLEAQQQPAPVAPEPDQAPPAAAQPQPPDSPAPREAPPSEAPAANPFAQPPVEPPIEPPAQPPVRPPSEPPAEPPADPRPPTMDEPPYSPQPAPPAAGVIVPPEDPFLPPAGMATPPECLIDLLGFYGHHPFVYSDSNCYDLASAAYRYGYYLDAIALLSHAIEQYPQAHYHYLRGMAQMKAGLAHDAIASADGVLDAIAAGNYGGLDIVSERFNGPLGKQFQELLDLRRAAR